ncbi:MAG: hypothetical protein GEV28_36200, partial [Actinophytocola sp.]|uniref:hypothetical protein n=1 Tax=Actinophytocola sp. TaxID=1872138 RepID=UPI001328AEEC
MLSSRSRGVLSRAVFLVLVVAIVLVGSPVGQPFSSGQWPGVSAVWQWLGSVFPEPAAAAAEPAPVREKKPEEPAKRVREVAGLATGSARVFAMSDGT